MSAMHSIKVQRDKDRDARHAAEARVKELEDIINEAANSLIEWVNSDCDAFGPQMRGPDPGSPGAIAERLKAAINK